MTVVVVAVLVVAGVVSGDGVVGGSGWCRWSQCSFHWGGGDWHCWW